MSDLLKTLAAYVPPDITQAILAGPSPTLPTQAESKYIEGAVLFADVSGFTPLTEALAQKGAEGPEELTRLLNTYFSRMIALIETEGGEVVKFSGDAVTVVFPVRAAETVGQATRRARQAAEAMQAAMHEFATLETSVGPVALGMKIGIGAGEILTAQVGGVFQRWEYVIAGDPLRQVAEAEHQAERGEIVLSPEAEAAIFPQALAARALVSPAWTAVQEADKIEAILRCYVPGAVTSWLQEGLQKWLAVLRSMSVLFIGVGGFDYSREETVERLHTFLRSAQEIIYGYEGSINKLAVDDKGTIFITLFGAPPLAHEDDPERALRCAIDLQAMAESQDLQLAVGVTTGRVFAGPVGSETRREYTVMGDTVNLAARLMGAAGMGEIRCDHETYRLTRSRMTFDALPPVRLKGKAGLIRLYRPVARVSPGRSAQEQSVLVGRKAELARFNACLDGVAAGDGRILILEGEAGVGKSRLIEELSRLTRERGLVSLLGMGRSIERQTPYRAWHDIFVTYFALDEVKDPAERRRRVESQVREMTPELVERTPLLNDVLNLGLPENDLTASLDTELRHDSLVSLLLTLLRTWAVERSLILILEDAHWLDPLSWDLTLQVARTLAAAHIPLLLIAAMRPMRGEAMRIEPITLAGLPETEQISLDTLAPEETVALAAARLGVTADDLPADVSDLIWDRAGGNPFIAEELVYKLRDDGIITIVAENGRRRCQVSGDLDQAVQTLPDTIQGLVLSRIDKLPPEEQLALKVAAVIGRTFAYKTLYETLTQHNPLSERMLKIYLDDLGHLDLTPLEAPEPELAYIFKHIITQEVAYKTLLFAQRRQLHRTVARWYEQAAGTGAFQEPPRQGLAPFAESPLTPFYPLLAYHWQCAEDTDRERHYAWLAGKRAAAQFANENAVAYLSRALALTPEQDIGVRYTLLLAREAVNDLRGEREAQAEDLAALTNLAMEADNRAWQTTVALRRAGYAEVTSDYGESLAAAQEAVTLATTRQDQESEVEGYIAWGIALWRQSNYETAREQLEKALALAQATSNRQAEARSLYYLGQVYLYQNDHAAAKNYCRQALEIYRAIGRRQQEADTLNVLGIISYELGDLPAARDHYEKVLSIFRTMGDRRGETIVLGNLGTVYCDWGDFGRAKDCQEQSLALRRAIGDRWGEELALVNLGLVHCNLGDYQTARATCERALAIQREIGDRSTQGYTLTYLGHALAGLDAFDEAVSAYDEAINLRRELGEQGAVMDDLAGLARVALARSDIETASAYVEEILAWLAENDTGGVEYPLQVYLTCYQVLQAAAGTGDDDRAVVVLTKAHAALMEQAAGLGDSAVRRSFLENVAAHRDILAAWQARQALSPDR